MDNVFVSIDTNFSKFRYSKPIWGTGEFVENSFLKAAIPGLCNARFIKDQCPIALLLGSLEADRLNLIAEAFWLEQMASTAKRDKKELSSFLSLLICPALSGYPSKLPEKQCQCCLSL
jgi:hypothetical protein